MKKYICLIILLLILLPLNTLALSNKYEDKIASITSKEIEKDKINIYLFKGQGCPHCREEEKWLKEIKKTYNDSINIYEFEVWYNEENAELMNKVKEELNATVNGVPFTIIGDKYYVGFSDTISSNMENKICDYLEIENKQEIEIPILGKINARSLSFPVVAIILGFIDGFNPCAMWILLFLINMLFNMKDKNKGWLLGIIFLLVSGIVYFLSMIGINIVLQVATIEILKILIAIFILGAGVYNFNKYLKSRKEETGCTVVDDKKRKKLITRIRKIISSKSFTLSVIGIMTLAVSVNLIELACSLGFPMIYTELLAINNIRGIEKIVYLILYIIFYMLDDIVVFTISMITLESVGISNKYSKITTLISSIIMILMGLLLMFKPEWLMLNF